MGSTSASPWILRRVSSLAWGTSSPLQKIDSPIRIGILGAANIAPSALIIPSGFVPEVFIAAIAARDEQKAKAFAAKHKIPKYYGSYEALLGDPEIDAVYIPTPNSLHLKWTLEAIKAGKHVLVEKPLASNEDEAREMHEAASKSDRVVMEAFHYRYHPAMIRLKEILQSGEIGEVKNVLVKFYVPSVAFGKDDIRFNVALSGGAMMDTGCYVINAMRYVLGEPTECTKAEVTTAPYVSGIKDDSQRNEIDGTTIAEFNFENGATARIETSLVGSLFGPIAPTLEIQGTKGSISVYNFILLSVYHTFTVTIDGKTRTEREYGDGNSTYYFQLKAFADAIRNKTPFPTTTEDGIANMRAIDMIYRKAGLHPRAKYD